MPDLPPDDTAEALLALFRLCASCRARADLTKLPGTSPRRLRLQVLIETLSQTIDAAEPANGWDRKMIEGN
jgi:hypothetical protein